MEGSRGNGKGKIQRGSGKERGRQREVDCGLVWGASPPIAIGNAAKFL